MAAGAADFLKHLEASGLLAAEDVAALRVDAESAGLDAQALAVRLVQQQKLTPYQANQLLAGKYRGFFIKHYKILEPLGQGGMGMVFKAEHTVLRRLAAIKVLPPKSAANRDAVARFHREARAAAQLQHENIVSAHDVGEAANVHYITMEFVPGLSLNKLIGERGRLPAGETAAIMHQVALGLEHAFQQGVIHRDIKPSNIIVTPEGKAKVLDLGLARFFGESADDAVSQATLTLPGSVVGTVDYIAPEQAEDSHQADTRSDIYALGCTLYHCLTGRVPFDGSMMQKLLAHRERTPTPIDMLVPDVPAGLAAVVGRMMAKRPDDRFQRPGDAAKALLPFVPASLRVSTAASARARPAAAVASIGTSDVPSGTGAVPASTVALPGSPRSAAAPTSQPPSERTLAEPSSGEVLAAIAAAAVASPLPTLSRSASRQIQFKPRQLAIVASVAAAVLAVSLAVWGWSATNYGTVAIDLPAPEPGVVTAARTKAETKFAIDGQPRPLSGEGVAEIRLRAGRHQLQIEWPGFEPVDQSVHLRRGDRVAIELKPTVQTLRWREMTLLADRVKAGLPDDPAASAVVALRQEIQKYARTYRGTAEGAQATALLAQLPWPIDALRRERIAPDELAFAAAPFSKPPPDELVAIFGSSRLRHWNAVRAVAISPDAKTVAAGGDDNIVMFWDAETGKLQHTLTDLNSGVLALAYSPEGDELAVGLADHTVRLWETSTWKQTWLLKGHGGAVTAVAFSPDPAAPGLATASKDSTVRLWDLQTGEETETFTGHAKIVWSVDFSPDGQSIASAGQDGTVRLWGTSGGDEGRVLGKHAKEVRAVKFTPDGRTVASAGQDHIVSLWDVASGEERRVLEDNKHTVHCLTFTPDGQTLAAGTDGGLVSVWNVAAGEVRATLSGHRSAVYSVAISRDGSMLASGALCQIRLWDLAEGKELLESAGQMPSASSLAFSPDGRLLFSGGGDGVVRLWDPATGKELYTLGEGRGAIDSLAISPDGKLLASAVARVVTIWDVATREPAQFLRGHGGTVRSVAFSSDGKYIATGGDDRKVRIWEPVSGVLLHTLDGHEKPITAVEFSPDGQMLASGSSDKTIHLWDASTGKSVHTLKLDVPPADCRCLSYSPDGSILLAGGDDRKIKLWDPLAARVRRVIDAHDGTIVSLAYSPGGQSFASSSHDGSVRLWSPRFGRAQQTLALGLPGWPIHSVTFSPDGRHLATANANGTIYILRLGTYRSAAAK